MYLNKSSSAGMLLAHCHISPAFRFCVLLVDCRLSLYYMCRFVRFVDLVEK